MRLNSLGHLGDEVGKCGLSPGKIDKGNAVEIKFIAMPRPRQVLD